MAQMQQSVDIARPLEEVFAFVANSANDALWGSNLMEVTKISPGPIGMGARFRYKARFAGWQFELVREVTEYEPNRRQAVKTISGPLRFGGVRTFEAIPGGTRLTLTGGGRAGGFFGPGRAAAAARRPAVVADRPGHSQAPARGPAPSLATHQRASRPDRQAAPSTSAADLTDIAAPIKCCCQWGRREVGTAPLMASRMPTSMGALRLEKLPTEADRAVTVS
jgi:hypothetical protein